MKVLENSKLPNETEIQIEDWNEDYDFIPYASTIGCYAISKFTRGGVFGPREGKFSRFQFDFESQEEAKMAFDDLVSGKKTLSDFKENMDERSKYGDCI